MPHPGTSYGYRIEHNGKVFVYSSDCEFNIEKIDDIQDYHDLFIDADILFFDTQYTFEESMNKMDWGHSSASIAIDIAGRFNIKQLVLFHHDPAYDDEKLDNVLANARIYQRINAKKTGNLKVDIAYEGLELEI
jgi:ribonuclease BN (tRNA processing enzyme)